MSLSNPESFRKDIVNPKAEVSENMMRQISLEIAGDKLSDDEVRQIGNSQMYMAKDPTKVSLVQKIYISGHTYYLGTKLPEYPLNEAS